METVLTKTELINTIYEKVQSSKADIKNILETLLNIMKSSIKIDNSLLFSGFGKFEVCNKNTRNGRNPHTQKPMTLEARKVIVFRISKKFRSELNNTIKV